MLKLLSPLLDQVIDDDDEAIAASSSTLLEKAKVLAEGSGALPLAALEQVHKKLRKKKSSSS